MTTNNFEIERKYLVKQLPENLEKYKHSELEQAYISTKPTIRIRKKDSEYILTVKGKGNIKKVEYELNISKEEYENLFNKVEGKIVKKTRYFIPLENELIAEFDIYHDFLEGHFTVEVEFPNEKICDDFIKPYWFGEDVSLDKRYTNASLSKGDFIPCK